MIPRSDSAHEYGYAMEGFVPVLDGEGGAVFISTAAEGASVPVESAWAVDVNGKSVPTHYEVRGNELVQVVVPNKGTAYPIVADPTWGWKLAAWGLTLNRSEVAGISSYGAAVGMCAALVKKAPVLICGAWAEYLFTQANTANRLKPKGCLHVVVAPAPGAVMHVKC